MYHNPVCSKSRGALEILGEQGVDGRGDRVPQGATDESATWSASSTPSPIRRRRWCARTSGSPSSGSTPPTTRRSEQVVALLLEHPELMERPVVFRGERAVIARPSEKVLELLD